MMTASMTRALRACAPGALIAATLMMSMPQQAHAQQVASRVDAKGEWSVFTADADGKVCWIVTEPKTSTAKRGGKPVQVSRGDIYLMVSVRPNQGVKNEVSVVSGYPYEPGGAVTAEIGSQTFSMFTTGENGWLNDPQADERMVVAMKRGAAAEVTGSSARGTQTFDTFSLRGFTAALGVAQDLCK
jgi:invasion protein IalB